MKADPIELLQLCCRAATEGAPEGARVPQLFSSGDYEALWQRNAAQVRRLLDELLCAAHADVGLELLMRGGVLSALFPELAAIKNLGDDPVASLHKDVWEHTKQVVMGVPPVAELRWGSLFHDVGKATTRRVDRGKVTFHNHDVVGARMVDNVERRLGLFGRDSALHLTVRTLVLNHLRPPAYKKSWTDSGVRRLLADLGGMQNFERLMALSRADLTTKSPTRRARALARARELEERVAQVFMQDNAPRLPKGTMGIIMSKVAARPGRWLNDLRDQLEQAMAVGHLPADQSVDFYVAKGLELLQRAESATCPPLEVS